MHQIVFTITKAILDKHTWAIYVFGNHVLNFGTVCSIFLIYSRACARTFPRTRLRVCRLWFCVICSVCSILRKIFTIRVCRRKDRSIPIVMCMRIRTDWIYYRVLSTQCDDEKHHLPRFLLFFAVFFFFSFFVVVGKMREHRQGQTSASDNGDDVDGNTAKSERTQCAISIYMCIHLHRLNWLPGIRVG